VTDDVGTVADVDGGLLVLAPQLYKPVQNLNMIVVLENKLAEVVDEQGGFVVLLDLFRGAVGEVEVQVGVGELLELDAGGALSAGVLVGGVLAVHILGHCHGQGEGVAAGLALEKLRVPHAVVLYLVDNLLLDLWVDQDVLE